MPLELGVNIDHVATIRQARGGIEPDPVEAAVECEAAGAHSITIHLREDRRHIQDRDLKLLRRRVQVKLNLEMAATDEMVKIALKVKPDQVTLVPEKRKELTTEGGLNLEKNLNRFTKAVNKLQAGGIPVSLFIDPDENSIREALKSGAKCVELHTGSYANAVGEEHKKQTLAELIRASVLAHQSGLKVHAGHGINYRNIYGILKIPYLKELNIGHSIISRAVFTGLKHATGEMLELMKEYN